MDYVVWVVLCVVLCFGFVLIFGAPYVPTLKAQQKAALQLLRLKKGDVVYELGCGDGKMLIAFAKQGARAIGYELNPILASIAWLRTRRYKKLVTVRCGNFWRVSLSEADAIYVFLLQKYMQKLDTKIIKECKKPVKLASLAFTVHDRLPSKQRAGVFVYEYNGRQIANKN